MAFWPQAFLFNGALPKMLPSKYELQKLYNHLFSILGPTFACIIGIQFQKIKRCDRFWYENNAAGNRFSEAQLTEIRKITLSKIICENCDIVGDIQRSIFDQPHEFL